MQLVFTLEEFRLLVDILLESERDAIKHGRHNCPASPLLQKALAHDLLFGIDELEDLEEILKAKSAKLVDEAAECEGMKTELESRRKLLENVMDRVTEACAMA